MLEHFACSHWLKSFKTSSSILIFLKKYQILKNTVCQHVDERYIWSNKWELQNAQNEENSKQITNLTKLFVLYCNEADI